MSIETYEANTFSMIISWTLDDGSVKDLTGATVEASARDFAGGQTVDLAATVIDGAAGQVRISAPAFAYAVSTYDLQVVVTKDSVTRTYADKIVVRDSIKVAI